MSINNRHTIQKQVFNFTFRESKDSFPTQQRVSTICKEELIPLLDDLFSRLVDETSLIQIDKLEIDIGSIAPHDLEKRLPGKIVMALEQEIQALLALKGPEKYRVPLNVSRFDAWLIYLEKGTMPWQIEGIREDKIQQAVLEALSSSTKALGSFRSLAGRCPIVLDRLVKQSTETFLLQLMKACFGEKQIPFVSLRQQLEEFLGALPTSLSNSLFSIRPFVTRSFFLFFWQTTFTMALQNKQAPEKNVLIIKVLENYSQKPLSTNLRLEIKAEIEQAKYATKPLLKDAFSLAALKGAKTQEYEPTLPTEQQIEALKPTPIADQLEGVKSKPQNLVQQREEEPHRKTISEKEKTIQLDLAKNEHAQAEARADQAFIKKKELKELPKLISTIDQQEASTPKQQQEKEQEAHEIDAIPKGKTLPSKVIESDKTKTQKIEDETNLTNEEGKKALPSSHEASTIASEAQRENTPQRPKKTPVTKERIIYPASFKMTPLADIPDETYYYIQNAGTVLVHPFLKTYFKTLGLLKEGQFVNIAAREKAIHLLHYLSTGETMSPEYDLVISKFLCALAFDFPIDRKVILSQRDKKEGDQLLQAVIDHWGALGKVGPDSLREGFLVREGKLEKRSNGWFLIVEKKTIDILLGQLPWGIGMVTLPWMEEILKVEWI